MACGITDGAEKLILERSLVDPEEKRIPYYTSLGTLIVQQVGGHDPAVAEEMLTLKTKLDDIQSEIRNKRLKLGKL